MLLQLRVENHRSLRDEQRLTLTTENLADSPNVQLLAANTVEQRILPAAAIYGANASGKTNVLLALGFMRSAVTNSHRIWEPESGVPNEPFALSGRRNEPSLYDIDFIVNGIRHRYGFILSSARVEEEWLEAWPQGRKQTWFTRKGDKFVFGRNLQGENEAIRGLTRQNSLFLSAAAQNNHATLIPLYSWFRRLRLVLRTGRYSVASYSRVLANEVFGRQMPLFSEEEEAIRKDRDALVRLLKAADTGILDIKLDDRDGAELERRRVPTRRSGTLLFKHRVEGSEGEWLPLEVQSAGTITLLEIGLRLVHTLKQGGVLCVDELESSLHPALALELLRLFHSKETNSAGAQLVFTTHDTNLLGNILGPAPLRRDQIWFTEKDQAGATHLYPLTDFHPRKEENLERGYLQGRYGAIPFLGTLVPEKGLG